MWVPNCAPERLAYVIRVRREGIRGRTGHSCDKGWGLKRLGSAPKGEHEADTPGEGVKGDSNEKPARGILPLCLR